MVQEVRIPVTFLSVVLGSSDPESVGGVERDTNGYLKYLT